MIKGLTLEGSMDGLYYLFVPKWEKLQHFKVWEGAAQQAFFSLGMCMGVLPTLSSYNKFNNNFVRDVTVISLIDFVTSIIMSIAMFSILGHLSLVEGVPIDQVAEKGQGLIFVVFPEALSKISPPWLWSLFFFIMIFFLGLDSEFVIMEGIIKVITDACPSLRKRKVVID